MAIDVAEGSSSADVQKRYPALEPKHDIFLSHSGKDKDFAGLLYERLKDRGYCPFFDKSSDSLPPGANASVANLLFDAARQCRVLIVIVSEAFFTNSEWPMLELSAFVQSQREALEKGESAVSILPVYLGLTKNDVKDEARRKSWCEEHWSKMKEEEAKKGTGSDKPPIDTDDWWKAVQVLVDQSGKYTSCEYKQASGYTGLLTETVNALCGLLAHPEFSPDSAVQGRERICNAINQLIEDSQRTKNGVSIVGLHGMAGSGKTTFCKELCAMKYREFEGKVCHVEFPSESSRESQKEEVTRKEEVMRKLTHINPCDIQKIDLGRVGKEKVFLILDNVKSDVLEEAREYLQIWKESEGKGSVVIVTAQHIATLGHLGISDCLEMPELTDENAKSLFLLNAAPNCEFKPEDDKYIQYCMRQCCFQETGIGINPFAIWLPNPLADQNWHYHPLALKVLGAQLQDYGTNPKLWKENLSKDDNFNQRREPYKEHPIFRILRRGYDRLRTEDKLLFMDVALFSRHFFYLDDPDHRGAKFFDWMSIVYYPRSLDSIKHGLQVLRQKALIVDDNHGQYSVHDLFYEFAMMESKLDETSVVFCSGEDFPNILGIIPSGNCWEQVKRMSLTVTHERAGCSVCEEIADEGEIEEGEILADLKSDFSRKLDDSMRKFDNYRNNYMVVDFLSWFDFIRKMDDIMREFKNSLRECEISMRKLQKLRRKFDNFRNKIARGDANEGVAGCHIFSDRMDTINGMEWKYFSNVVALHIHIYSSLDLDLSDLGQQLRSLRIYVKKGKLVGLGKLRNLGWLDLTGMHWATCAEDIVSLKQLRVLRLRFNRYWRYWREHEPLNLDNVKNCTRLEDFQLENCGGLRAFPDLSEMRNIRKVIFFNCIHPTKVVLGLLSPQWSKLEELRLNGCESLRLPNLAGLVAMQVLELSNSCFGVKQFLGLETMTGLQVLIIKNVPELLELPQLAGLIALKRLGVVSLPKVREFPDIRHLKKLQIIHADSHLRDILKTKTDIFICFAGIFWPFISLPDWNSVFGEPRIEPPPSTDPSKDQFWDEIIEDLLSDSREPRSKIQKTG